MYNKILYYIILMPRRKKSRRRKQKGGSDPKLHDYRDTGGSGESKGGLNEPLINKPQSSSKTKNLKRTKVVVDYYRTLKRQTFLIY